MRRGLVPDFAEIAGSHVEDEASHGVTARDERAGLDPIDGSADVVIEVREHFRRPRRARTGLFGQLTG